MYVKLDWSTIKGKEEYEYDDPSEYLKLKEQDLRESMIFNSTDDFELLHQAVNNVLIVDNTKSWNIVRSIEIIGEQNFLNNNELGFQFLKSILFNYQSGFYPMNKIIEIIVKKSKIWARKYWNLISTWNHEHKLLWRLGYFKYLPEDHVTEETYDLLVETINSIDKNCFLEFETFERFKTIDKSIIDKILRIVVEKIEIQQLLIQLSYEFFEKYSDKLSGNFDLLSKAYIQQEQINFFDPKRKGLRKLLEVNPLFLTEYISTHYNEKKTKKNNGYDRNLDFIWEMDNMEHLIEESINRIIDGANHIDLDKYSIIIFFQNFDVEKQEKLEKFILEYIAKYHDDSNKIDAMINVVNRKFRDMFEQFLLTYLKCNQNVEDFNKIHWLKDEGFISSNVNLGDILASKWRGILEIVNKSEFQSELIPIKAQIKENISRERRFAEEYRKRKAYKFYYFE